MSARSETASETLAAPSAKSPPAGRTCRRCGWCGEPEAAPTSRCPVCKSFLSGNVSRLRHGKRATGLQVALVAEARAALAERRAAIAADLGGELPTLAADVLDRYLAATALLQWLEGDLLAHGTLTERGRRRSALDGYLALLDRALRIAQTLGLERKEKPAEDLSAWAERVERESREREAAGVEAEARA